MGILKWLFGGGKKKRDFPKIEKLLGKWEPYTGKDCLVNTRIPKRINLPSAVAKWGDYPGEVSISTALFPYWLRIDPAQAGYLIMKIREGSMYTKIEIPREGKTPRIISAPTPRLKLIQRRILERILEQVEINSSAYGFVKGKSIFSAAEAHTGKRVVACFDIRDFFPSIKFARVYGMFKKIGFEKKCSTLLAGLCCNEGCLPQGAPTSPMISNMICKRLDSRLAGLAKKQGFSYSRYADDIIFSGNEKLIRFMPFIRQIIEKEGFKLANEKVRIKRSGSRQKILGLNVNTKVSVPRKVRRLIRAMVHRQKTTPAPEMLPFLYGHVAFMRPVHPGESEKLKAELDRSLAPTHKTKNKQKNTSKN